MMQPPKIITAGTSALWAFSDDREGEWVYYLRGPGAHEITGTTENGQVTVSASADATAAWAPGLYEWRLYLQNGTDRQSIAGGKLTVEADFTKLPAGHDGRSHAQRMLDAIEATLEGRVISDHEKYSIDGRSLDRIPIEQLHKLRRQYKRTVMKESGMTPALVPGRIRTRLPG